MILSLFLLACTTSTPTINGTYQNTTSNLTLLETDNGAMIFYDSVFGPTAHICQCLLTLVGSNGVYSLDNAGTKLEIVIDDQITMKASGDLPCCGSNWQGDTFDKKSKQDLLICKLESEVSLSKTPSFSSQIKSKNETIKPGSYVGFPVEGDFSGWTLVSLKGKSGLIESNKVLCK